MPTITFSVKDLRNLAKIDLGEKDIERYASFGKGELESFDRETGEAKIEFGDTNMPYLWSVEGFARLIRHIEELEKGIPPLKPAGSERSVLVDPSVSSVRPYITAFTAHGSKIDDYLLKQLIQLQEKLCDSFGRKREKVAIGIYQLDKIRFPVTYKAVKPGLVRFVPLGFEKEMTPEEILNEHPKGIEYGHILEGMDKYPLIIDDSGKVLSFPPIINSLSTGKITAGDDKLFFEATGTDSESLNLAAAIFAYALSDRGFSIGSVEIVYKKEKITAPVLKKGSMKITASEIKKYLGISLDESEIRSILQKMQYGYDNGKVLIPPYRNDIMHPSDIIEDIGIGYGYDNIPEVPLSTYTHGQPLDIVPFIDRFRELLIGLGFQEILSPILSNKETLYQRMFQTDLGTVEIEKFMSERYSVVRSWLIPILVEFLGRNLHQSYPQKIFEQGLVAVNKNGAIHEYERLALAIADEKSDYTKARQVLDYILRIQNIQYQVVAADHPSFIPGRVGRVLVNDKKIGFIGDLSPSVLEQNGLLVPVSAVELNLSELFKTGYKS